MTNFSKIARESDLPASNQAKEFPCGSKMICVANVDGAYSALDNVCLHQGGPLGEGTIEHGKLLCPWHAWAYDPKTGELSHNRHEKVAAYPLKIENGDVLIEI